MFEDSAEINFVRSLLESNVGACKEIAKKYSPAELRAFVNKDLGSSRVPSCIHIAAHKLVSLEVWKYLCPLAEKEILYRGITPLNFILPERDALYKESVLKSIPEGLSLRELVDLLPKSRVGYASLSKKHAIKNSQLNKVRFWLEFTKDSRCMKVCKSRSDLLCSLCRYQGSTGEGEASFREIFALAKDIITDYYLDINGTPERCPIHWALERHNRPLFQLFLSNGADVNAVEEKGQTPLMSMTRLTDWKDRLEVCQLLIKHGADPFIDVEQNAFTGFHSVLIALQPYELDSFLKNSTEYINLTSERVENMTLPPVHGLIVFVKNKRNEDIQKAIIEKIEILCKFGLNTGLTDIHSRTILHYACWLRINCLVKYLVSVKMNLLQKDAFGRDCIYYAMTCPSDDSLTVDNPEENMSALECIETILKQDLSGSSQNKTTSFVQNHFILTKEQYKRDMKGITFVEFVLKDSQIGPVRPTKFVEQIKRDAWELVNKLQFRLVQKNKAFEATIELAGSMQENTKVNPPDEFDFQFHFTNLSKLLKCNAAKMFDLTGEIRLFRNNAENNHGFDDLLENTDSLNLNISKLFYASSYSILQERSFWDGLPFYWHIVHDYIKIKSLINPLTLVWVSPEGKDLKVSVDLVPIIVQNQLPTGTEARIPKPVRDFVKENGLKWLVVCRNDTFARFSFFNLERAVLGRLYEPVKEAYTLTKCILKYIGQEKCTEITSYMIKNALFQALDPGGSYNLLNSDVATIDSKSYLYSLVLGERRKMLRENLRNETEYIRDWALRITYRLELCLKSEVSIPVYCLPGSDICHVAIVSDENGDNPYLKTIAKLKEVLND